MEKVTWANYGELQPYFAVRKEILRFAALPTFLIADIPKRILLSATSKFTLGSFTSGGNTSIFSLRQFSKTPTIASSHFARLWTIHC